MTAQEPIYRVAISRHKLTHKIPPGDSFWPTFNAGFENLEVSPLDLLEAVYNGRAFTTWHRCHWRSSENYEAGQHLGLDFDQGDDSSRLARLVSDKFIARYAAFAYTTPSHTPEAPRARVVFLLDTPIMQARNYTLAASALLWYFGTADRQCRDAVRFFYGSVGCDVEFLDHVLPLEVVRHMIAQYQETGRQERRQTERHLDAGADLQEVADALRRIPPWQVDYDEWVQVLMALHATYGDGARALADTWADGTPGEVDRKWKSFKADGNAAGAVTIATLFGIAKRFGWRKAA